MQKRLMARLTTAAVAASLTLSLAAPALADGTPAAPTPQATAASTTQAGAALPQVSVTPSSPFYWLKSMWEHVRLALSFSADAKANLYAQYAAERLAEAQQLAAQGQMGLAANALAQFKADIAQVADLVDKGGVTPEHSTALHTMLQVSQQAAEQVRVHLQPVKAPAPPTPAKAPTQAQVKAQAPVQVPVQAQAAAPATAQASPVAKANSDAALLSVVQTEAKLAVQAAAANPTADEDKDDQNEKQQGDKSKHAGKAKKQESKGGESQGDHEANHDD